MRGKRGQGEGVVSWPRFVVVPIGLLVFLLTLFPFCRTCRIALPWPAAYFSFYRFFDPWHMANPYGLFAVMTTSRLEIILEGSQDGGHWETYEFRYKPGEVSRRPAFAAPHQPRLDWQMWFAALGTAQENRWFLYFCQRLLEGSQEVSRLLKQDPFPDRPPRYLRAKLYDYKFSTPAQKKEKGVWWERELKGEYLPPISLRVESRE